MHDCASILDSNIIRRELLVPKIFCIIIYCIPTSPFIQLNDFCTCSTHFLCIIHAMGHGHHAQYVQY